ncbi:alpha/beta hydrolase [Bacillus sp. ISL-35]|uniref:alpha/beta hydrolase n=1 Tax=Bacillus sp. ISL-35 TaxID=2819122 RepID=UPI001BE74F69|nr:alpha/beta hydrolase [Bacillus sp. ISL-35]MBT2680276.1 alpha/beta hydrolase [Bacillus sp. ISL-35]MBT2702867.1 alpha/beta hydrolase [Chryseobacterium sp. ISL-80]
MGFFLRKPDFHIPADGIDQIKTISIGGIQQTILIQSHSPENPVLLFLHGGPSMPLPGVSSRGKDYTVATNTRELVKHFTVVFWDQRGTGKSYHKNIPPSSMTFDQLVSDTAELTDFLRDTFSQDKIFLAAHSFGTLIGMYLLKKHPEKFHSYVGISQIISWTDNDRSALIWVKEEAKRRGDYKALNELEEVGDPPFTESYKQWGVLRKWQMKYNSMVYQDDTIKHPGLAKVSLGMLTSKDYRLTDVFHSFYSGFKLIYTDEFIQNIPKIDVQKDVPQVMVPVTFIHGRKDVHVSAYLVEEYFNTLKTTKEKRFIWTEKSAHLFHPEDTALIEQHLIEELKHIKAEVPIHEIYL